MAALADGERFDRFDGRQAEVWPAEDTRHERVATRSASTDASAAVGMRGGQQLARPHSAPRGGRASAFQARQPIGLAMAGFSGGSSGSSCGTPSGGGTPRAPAASAGGTSQRPRSAPPARAPQPSVEATMPLSQEVPRNFGSRLQQWELRHEAFKQRQLQARQEKEVREMQQCTFRPTLNAKSDFYARRTRGCLIEPLAERLHHEADKRATLRHKARELLEADMMCSYTFQPQINKHRVSASNHAPIHLRTEAIQQTKQQKMLEAQAAEDRKSECSFQPKISSQSERIVQKKRDKIYRSLSRGDGSCLKFLGPVEERLYADAKLAEERRQAKLECASELSQSNPSVDSESRRICRSSVYFQGAQQDFITRQQTFELAKQRRMEMRTQHAEADCSFRPKISETSRQMVSTNLDFLGETVQERVQRLAVKDVQRREELRGALQQLHYQECTFKPEVNAVSQQLASRAEGAMCGSKVPVHDRLYKAGLAKARVGESSQLEDCSFRPQLDPATAKRFAHVKPHYSSNGARVMENIREELERREEHVMERRRELEERERAECTFTPGTRKVYEEPDRPVVVNGLGRFFELKSLALRKQQEQQEREVKAFRPEVARARCSGVTIPEPFGLSGPRDEVQRSTSRRPSGVGQALDCTPAPQAKESAKREARQLAGSAGEDNAQDDFAYIRPYQMAW